MHYSYFEEPLPSKWRPYDGGVADAEIDELKDRSWADAPWTVKAYAALYVVGYVVGVIVAAIQGKMPSLWTVVGSVIFFVLLVVPIIRGWRAGWAVVLLLTVASLFIVPSQEPVSARAIAAANQVLSIVLLLHPQTQRWCRVRL